MSQSAQCKVRSNFLPPSQSSSSLSLSGTDPKAAESLGSHGALNSQ